LFPFFLDFDLNIPSLVENSKRSTDLVTIHKDNVECRTRNIEYRSDESLRSLFFYQRIATSKFM
jgi:hypothetical protein